MDDDTNNTAISTFVKAKKCGVHWPNQSPDLRASFLLPKTRLRAETKSKGLAENLKAKVQNVKISFTSDTNKVLGSMMSTKCLRRPRNEP